MTEDLSRWFELSGRVAVVTGAASGIGRETARVLAQAGASVIAADLDEAGLAETVRLIEAAGGQGSSRRVDIAQRAQVEALAAETAAAAGRLDVWVNCAGVIVRKPVLEVTEQDVDFQFGVNLKGVYWGCAAAGRAMLPLGRGSIINISSGGGDTASPGISVYSATKAGVNAVTRACAVEFGAFGVRVNSIAPGLIDTPLTSVGRDADPQVKRAFFAQAAKSSPLNLTGEPLDIALAVLYLACDASRFVTGQVLRANGGVFML
jgi:3-oxoacyl-[acyl-carrier protein] reductase